MKFKIMKDVFETEVKAWLIFFSATFFNDIHSLLSSVAIFANIFYIGYKIYSSEKDRKKQNKKRNYE